MDLYELEVIDERTSQRRRVTAEGEEPDDAIEWARRRGFSVFAFRLLNETRWQRLERAARAYGKYDQRSGAYLGSNARGGRDRKEPARNPAAAWCFGFGFSACCFLCVYPAVGAGFGVLGFVLALAGLANAIERRGAGLGYVFAGVVLSTIALVGATVSLNSSVPLSAPPPTPEHRQSSSAPHRQLPPAAQRASSSEDGLKPADRQPERTAARQLDNTNAVEPASVTLPETLLRDATAEAAEPPSMEPTITWFTLGEIVRVGDAALSVVDARLDRVSVEDPSSTSPIVLPFERLIIALEVTHAGTIGRVDYRTLRTVGSLSLHDDLGRLIRLKSPGLGVPIVGAVDSASLRAGESVQDLLIFARPEPEATSLDLTIPAATFGEHGDLRFRFAAPRTGTGD